MKRLITILLALITALSALTACGEEKSEEATEATAAPAEQSTVVSDDTRETIKEQFEKALDNHTFRGAVYVVYKGEEVYSDGTGKANKKENTDNGADVVYHIASITKQFTAAAILQLCEQGKMRLDDTLGKYYPEYEIGADITIHNLLSMQSGIPDFARNYDEDGYEMTEVYQAVIDGVSEQNSIEENRAALREWILSQDLLFEQGERFSYCNSNYFLLGEIIEKVSGESYFDYLQTKFFDPLGMETAGFMENYDNPKATVAKGYYGSSNADEIFNAQGVAFACGDMMASPKDMYQWSIALHGGKVLGEEMYQKMIAPHAEGDENYSSYGYGLMIAPDGLLKTYFHSGSIPCFLSCVLYAPDADLYVAVMSNYADASMMSVTGELVKIVLQELGLMIGQNL